MKSHLVDMRPLREAAFRRLWVASTLSTFTAQLVTVAALSQVWDLTRSALAVGIVGLAQAVASIAFGVYGGTVADRFNRRSVVVMCSLAQCLAALGVGVLTATADDARPATWAVLSLVALRTAFAALGAPARRSLVPGVLPHESVGAGVALTHLSFQASLLTGPALAGVIIAVAGYPACYFADAAALVIAASLLRRTSVRKDGLRRGASPRGESRIHATFAGWVIIAKDAPLRAAFTTDLICTVLSFPVALFPVVNAERFDGNPTTLGLLFSALGAGGILAGTFSGRVANSVRPGLVMIGAALVWGAALVAFAFAGSLVAVLIVVLVAGAADTSSVIARGSLVQSLAPEGHRGRISAAEQIVGLGGPQLGNFRAGLVASATSATASAGIGGAMCIVGVALFALSTPALRSPIDRAREGARAQ